MDEKLWFADKHSVCLRSLQWSGHTNRVSGKLYFFGAVSSEIKRKGLANIASSKFNLAGVNRFFFQ